MRKILAASFGAALLSSAAMAADLPVKAPLYVPPPPTWTGFYIGGNAGYSWGEARTDINGTGTAALGEGFRGLVPGFDGFPTNFAFANAGKARLGGLMAGGQIGYNLQLSRWLLGIEADIQGSDEGGAGSFADPISTNICIRALLSPPNPPVCRRTGVLQGGALTSYEAKLNWFGTLRGRLGFFANDQLLIYGTGGLAYGGVELSGATVTDAFIPNGLPLNRTFLYYPTGTALSASNTNVGYSVGAGIEGGVWLPANWRWKVEYLYLDLGSIDASAPLYVSSSNPVLYSNVTGAVAARARLTDQIVRVGLNLGF